MTTVLYVEPRRRETCLNLRPARTLGSYVKAAFIAGFIATMMVIACRAFAAESGSSTWVLWMHRLYLVPSMKAIYEEQWGIVGGFDRIAVCRGEAIAAAQSMLTYKKGTVRGNHYEFTMDGEPIITIDYVCLPGTVDPRK